MTCSYPTCSNRPHRPFSDEAKWKITTSTTHNISIRGPNKRDIVEVAGNPEDGFCSPACAIRSRWYRSRLNVEPIWARSIVSAGDLKNFQTQLKEGREVEAMPEEVDLLEDMEDKGEIMIENGQMRRVDQPNVSRQPSANPSDGSIEETGAENQSGQSRKTEPIPKMELVAESREKPSSLMQRLEKTLAGLRIVEKAEPAGQTSQVLQHPSQLSQIASSSSIPSPASALFQTKQPNITAPPPARHDNTETSRPQSRDMITNGPRISKHSNQRRTQTDNGGDDSLEEESEDEETRMVFDLALAARGQLDDGTF